MVRFCCVPNCSSRSDRESHLSYFGLPLKEKMLLKQWVHIKNLPLNRNMKICSEHFVNACGRRLYPGKVPSLLLPTPSRTLSEGKARRKPRDCTVQLLDESMTDDELEETSKLMKEVSTQTEQSELKYCSELLRMKEKVVELEREVHDQDMKLNKQLFDCLQSK